MITSNKNKRKEAILFIRAQLRQNKALRSSIVNSICNSLNLEKNFDSINIEEHLTIALDEELNDAQAHVIL